MTAAPHDIVLLPEAIAHALRALEDLVVTVEFDCGDPLSVVAAIRSVEAAIDTCIATWRGHKMVESAIADLKAECRAGLLEQADDGMAAAAALRCLPGSCTLH